MNVIAKSHESVLWLDPASGLIARVAAAMERYASPKGSFPAQAVVLLPYAQLMPLAQKLWSQAAPDGFAPCF